MKEYVCTICGYVHKGELTDDFRCPVCGAGREAFVERSSAAEKRKPAEPPKTEDRELSAMEMSVICSNLARGCEKQYLADESAQFTRLAEFFRKEAGTEGKVKDLGEVKGLIDKELDEAFPYAVSVAKEKGDRGAMRSLVWGEKVTRMLQYLLGRYEKEGDRMLENTGVFICTVCGFVYLGDSAPDICPVCKVPSWKFRKLNGRAS